MVIFPVMSKADGAPIFISSSTPSKFSAFPLFPSTHVGPLVRIPALFFPEKSVAEVPAPSSKLQYPTSPVFEGAENFVSPGLPLISAAHIYWLLVLVNDISTDVSFADFHSA